MRLEIVAEIVRDSFQHPFSFVSQATGHWFPTKLLLSEMPFLYFQVSIIDRCGHVIKFWSTVNECVLWGIWWEFPSKGRKQPIQLTLSSFLEYGYDGRSSCGHPETWGDFEDGRAEIQPMHGLLSTRHLLHGKDTSVLLKPLLFGDFSYSNNLMECPLPDVEELLLFLFLQLYIFII